MPILRGENRVLKDERFLLEKNKHWEKDFFFIQAADTQLGLIHMYGIKGKGTPYPNSKWDKEIELCKHSVEILNGMKPRPAFFIVCGDLVDAFPDQYPEIRGDQEADLKSIYADLDPEIPMICVCGNHDVGNSPTQETISNYRNSFGDDYFYFVYSGVFFIVLNSQLYEDHSNVPQYYEKHEKWLSEILELPERKSAKHTVLFQHIPWFLYQADEGKDYFNIEAELRIKKLDQFYDAGIRKIFCGHYHRNAGGFYKDLEVVITSAIGCQLGSDDHGMRVVKVTEDRIEHEYHALSNFPLKNE